MALQNTRKGAPVIGGARTVGVAPARADLVDTATLIRGRVYSFRHNGETHYFEANVETPLEDKEEKAIEGLAGKLEELHSEVHDSDGDAFEKPLFLVKRGVARPNVAEYTPKKRDVVRLPPKPLPRPAR